MWGCVLHIFLYKKVFEILEKCVKIFDTGGCLMKIKKLFKLKLSPKTKKVLSIVWFILTPVALLGLMILVLNYTTKIWYYLKPKPILFTLFLLELLHILLTSITGSSKRSAIIQAILLWVLEVINKLRYTYTYEPLTFGDFVYARKFCRD